MTALSDLLRAANTDGVSARTIARAAGELGFTLNHDTAARYRPPAEASRLNRRQRRALDEVIRAMLQPATGRQPVTELKAQRAKKAAPRAARRGSVEPPQR